MAFRLAELYAELSVKGAPTVDAALAKVRREMVVTQRIAKSLGAELGLGTGMASELFKRATQQRLEPQLLRMQANLLAATGRIRGWSDAQGIAVANAVAMENALSKMSFRLGEVQNHFAALQSLGKYTFGTGLAAVLGTGALASPEAIKTLTDSFQRLGAEIGMAFVPYIAQAAFWVQKLSRWFHDLSDATKDNVAKTVIFATALAGITFAGGLVLSTVANIITGFKSLVDLYILFIARSRMVVAAHAAEAVAANVAAAAENRLAVARANAATTGGGGLLGGLGGSLIMGGMMGGIAYAAGSRAMDLANDLAETNKKGLTASGSIASIFKNVVPGWMQSAASFAGGFMPEWAKKMTPEAWKPLMGVDQGGTADNKGLNLSAIRQPMITSIADAWKQAQMQVTTGMGEAGEKISLQRQSLYKLQEIAANTRGDAPIGPQP